ncbi:MAG: hypothetical protein HYY26_02060 [Acidobacteria bacterium]|nr:hypothetical protein [Acidobacteriota bacterium]
MAAALIWGFRHVILYGREHHASPVLLVVAGLDALCGLANGLLLTAHLAAVLGRAMQGRGFFGAPAFSYDFTFKALVLVGVAIALPGFLCLAQARGLTRGARSAWSNAFWWSLWLLGINAFFWRAFAPLLALLAFLNLIGLVAARHRFRAPS